MPTSPAADEPALSEPTAPRLGLRDVLVVIAYALVVLVLPLFGIANSGFLEPDLGWGLEVSLPLLLVASAATLWRRRAPVVTLAVTGSLALADVVAGGQISAYVLLFEALFSPVSHGSRRLARATTLIAIAASVFTLVVTAAATGSMQLVLLVVMVATLVAATPLLWGWEVRHHRGARRAAEALARAEHDLAASRAAREVEGERRRIAHDLHDVIAGHLSAVSLHTSLASGLEDPAARDRSLVTARESAKAALRDLQSMISVLATEEPGTLPAATLDWDSLAERLRGRDPQAQVEVDPAVSDPARVEPSVQAALLRIAAEAVTNAVRHGSAPISLRVSLGPAVADGPLGSAATGGSADTATDRGADEVRLVLENRIGESAEPGTGLGIGAIGHRAEAVGGTARSGPVGAVRSDSPTAHRPGAAAPGSAPGTWRVQAHLPTRRPSALTVHPDQEVPA